MDPHASAAQAGIAKRIRQACASCRRKKIKCSGERPLCFHCRRGNQRCVYEPYYLTTGENSPPTAPVAPPTENADILHRISTLESRLAELSGRTTSQLGTLQSGRTEAEQGFPGSQSSGGELLHLSPYFSRFNGGNIILPPPLVLCSVIDTFFVHVHNQPYSYIQESSFRQSLELDMVPRCLLLAVLASAVRFSTHDYYEGWRPEATDIYAKESWTAVLTDHLTAEDNLGIEVIQTVNLLAIIEYTAGRISSAWLKIGLAARISQDLRLMMEPDRSLPFQGQEERRRVFWSGYLLDRLISCGRSRPLAFHDEDCDVQLPCDEGTFLAGDWKDTHKLGEALSWATKLNGKPSPFALVILMASVFGRCTRYVHRELTPDKTPPWDAQSNYSTINSSLLLLESLFSMEVQPIGETICGPEGANQAQAGHFIFAHTLYHLCHCLLNHPFTMRLRLKRFGSKVPASFATHLFQSGRDHAKRLLDVLRDAAESGYLVESSFYPYCVVIAGAIHSLASHLDRQKLGETQHTESQGYFDRSLEMLVGLGNIWAHAANMYIRLQEFNTHSQEFSSLLDPACLMEDLSPMTEEIFWSMIDYGTVGAAPGKRSLSTGLSMPSLPSPTSWALGSDLFAATPPGFDGSNGGIFTGLTSSRLRDADNL